MPLTYPSYDDLAALIRAEFRRQLPNVDPTVFGSWARAFGDGNATLSQAITFLVRDLEKQLFPQTATGDFLDRWGEYEGLERKAESSASGVVSLPGTNGTVVPFDTEFKAGNGVLYRSTSVATIVDISQSVATLTRSGSTVTATTSADHQLATGIEMTMAGADQAEYNETAIVTVIARDTFTYQISGTPATPATGTISYTATLASVSVEAQSTGLTTNLESGASLALEEEITGADDPALVQFDGITGGSSEETDDEYRFRILLSRSIIEGVFTPDQVKLAALSIAGNTRAFVKTPTASVCPGGGTAPVPGQVGVFVLRDNDPSIIPSQSILDQTKQAVIADGAMPANTSEADVFLEAPDLVETDFIFTALSPDTPTMRTAVDDQIKAFFEDTVEFEQSVTEASYLGAIQGTQDLQTGEFLVSFSLSSPSGDIVISDGEIAAAGDVSFTI
jgi:uncharacterized phage protein gp47/JayE